MISFLNFTDNPRNWADELYRIGSGHATIMWLLSGGREELRVGHVKLMGSKMLCGFTNFQNLSHIVVHIHLASLHIHIHIPRCAGAMVQWWWSDGKIHQPVLIEPIRSLSLPKWVSYNTCHQTCAPTLIVVVKCNLSSVINQLSTIACKSGVRLPSVE